VAVQLTSHELDQFTTLYRAIRNNPFAFAKLVGFDPTPQQAGLLTDVMNGTHRISVKSGHGTGKSTVSALISLWRILRAPYSRVIVTAPSMRQCKDIIMVEARKLINQGPRFLRDVLSTTQTKVVVGRKNKKDEDQEQRVDWGLHCVTASNPVNAQGYHGDHLSFIVDEASGVERAFIEAIEGTLTQTTRDFLFLQIGNPNTQDCQFFDTFHRNKKTWKNHTFDSRKSPIVAEEAWRHIGDTFGYESDVFRIRVMGEFPSQEPNAVMSLDDIEFCAQKVSMVDAAAENNEKQIGMDFARFGSDESTMYRRKGLAVVNWRMWAKKEPADVVAAAFVEQEDAGWKDNECDYVADADGMGQGLMVNFHRAKKRLLEFRSGSVSSRPSMFANKITEAWFCLRAHVKARRCHLPDDPILHQQLAGRLYFMTPKGQIILESKDDYKERTEQGSPDRADGCVMAFYRSMSGVKIEKV
jgi:phage terminase large subunit